MRHHIFIHRGNWADALSKSKAREYEMKAAQCLAEANQEVEKGNKAKAEELYAEADQWMHKMNVALGNATEDMESKPKPAEDTLSSKEIQRIKKQALKDIEYWQRREEDRMLTEQARAIARENRLSAQRTLLKATDQEPK